MYIYPRLQRQFYLKPLFYRYAKSKLNLSQLSLNRPLTKAAYAPQEVIDLKRGFDDEIYWEESKARIKQQCTYQNAHSLFSKFKNNNSHDSDGLFENPYLDSPKGLRQFSKDSLKYAHELVNKMKSDTSKDGLTKYVLRLDQLSDTLCRVIDLCEFIRSVHPDNSFIEAAQSCHEEMFEFMNILNTDVDLCKTLAYVLEDPEISAGLSQEEMKVGKILLEDFKKSGIYMNPEARDQFISLSQDISIVGQDFITNVDVVQDSYISVPVRDLDADEVSPVVINQLSKDITGYHYKIPCYGSIPFILLRTCQNENIRSKIWSSLHSSSKEQINRLTQLVKLRAILARIMRKDSYAAYQLEGKMAKNPHDVKMFLESLIQFTRGATAKELKPIADMKCKSLGDPLPQNDEEVFLNVRPWDRDYYSFQLKSQKEQNKPFQSPPLSMYFTIGSVIDGLSDIFQKIYGISFALSPTKPKEIWAPDVRKIIVTSEKEGPIGVIYCDLFERQGKPSSPAHFTVCCSREMYSKENNEKIMQIGVDSNDVKFQLPIISLVCSFTRSSEGACLLQLNEIETLFHEMGHAMHSMLGRTKLQNISGTRCATDFVELPSILMEHFARDERVLSNIGRHYLSGEQVPINLVRDQLRESSFLQNCETFAQAKMSMLDQRLHDEDVIENIDTLNVVKIYQDLEKELKVLVDDKTNWCGKFGHLFGYGATYYSYLFDRAIAAKIWDHLFAKNPYSRDNGDIFKNNVLKWGGLKDPWNCVADVLDNPELKKGDTNAIKYIAEVEDL
ncbi:mitochondrial intermediate peptidase [Monosporozyma unispora]